MPMTAPYAHEQDLLQRCATGDAAAFDALLQPYLAYLTTYLRQHVTDLDDADELLQDVLLKTCTYLREHPGVVIAFFPWVKTVTTNAVTDYWRRRGRRPVVSLEDEGVAEIADPVPMPEARVIAREEQQATRTLWDFLSKQLQEVFLANAATESERAEGLLRLLAFLLYYRDGQTAPTVHRLLTEHAARIGATPPSATTLNNWLSRGRLLRMVVQHLLRDHADALRAVVTSAVARLLPPRIEHRFARLYWCEGETLETISAAQRYTDGECAELHHTWADRDGTQAPLTFLRQPDVRDAPNWLAPDACAQLYQVVSALLQEDVFCLTKATLHARRKS